MCNLIEEIGLIILSSILLISGTIIAIEIIRGRK